jgi:hypothetical protein
MGTRPHEDRGKEAVMKWVVGAAALSLAMLLGTGAAQADQGTRSTLTAVSGQGTGTVKVSPTAEDQGTFHLQGAVNVHGALANTTFDVQRAFDLTPDGDCTSQDWLTLTTLTTLEGGAGAAHFERATPLLSGTQLDLIFRVISEDGTQLLISNCMTVTVK